MHVVSELLMKLLHEDNICPLSPTPILNRAVCIIAHLVGSFSALKFVWQILCFGDIGVLENCKLLQEEPEQFTKVSWPSLLLVTCFAVKKLISQLRWSLE